MKNLLIVFLCLLLMAANAEAKGTFEKLNCNDFIVHIYNSNDVMANTSLIVEGKEGLVLMELPLFKENAVEFDAYVKSLHKKVNVVFTDYREGYMPDTLSVMPKGMASFLKGNVYSSMMAHFKKTFGNTIVDITPTPTMELPFGEPIRLAGVSFTLKSGPTSDFPAASIIIGNQGVYYTHWAFTKAHMSHHQLDSTAAIDAEIDATNAAIKAKCKYYIGGHGGLAKNGDLQFRLNYLSTVKKLRIECATAADFSAALLKKYPDLPGGNGVKELAAVLYK